MGTLAEKIENAGIPTYLGGMARGLLGSESRVQCRHARGKALKEADLVILAGVSADFRLNYGRRSDFALIISEHENFFHTFNNSDK